MPLYILRCPGSDYTGFRGGVDFFNGYGSTSSLSDAHALAQLLKCGVSLLEADGSERRVRIIRKAMGLVVEPETSNLHQAEGVEASAPSVISTPEAIEADAAKREAEKALEAAERNPDSAWSKERKKRAAKKTKRRRI